MLPNTLPDRCMVLFEGEQDRIEKRLQRLGVRIVPGRPFGDLRLFLPAWWPFLAEDEDRIKLVDCQADANLEKDVGPPAGPIGDTELSTTDGGIEALADQLRRAAVQCCDHGRVRTGDFDEGVSRQIPHELVVLF